MRGLLGAIAGLALAGSWLAADSARPSPPFEIQRLNGPVVRVTQYRGKIVALAFIDTACVHCQELTATLNGIVRDYAARGVVVLGCAFNDGAQAGLAEFQQRFEPAFPMGWNTRAAVLSYLQYNLLDPRPLYTPHMVFIDRRGAIQADIPGEDVFFRDANANIRAELEKLLRGAGSAPPSDRGK
jgi:peroxiredoxin